MLVEPEPQDDVGDENLTEEEKAAKRRKERIEAFKKAKSKSQAEQEVMPCPSFFPLFLEIDIYPSSLFSSFF